MDKGASLNQDLQREMFQNSLPWVRASLWNLVYSSSMRLDGGWDDCHQWGWKRIHGGGIGHFKALYCVLLIVGAAGNRNRSTYSQPRCTHQLNTHDCTFKESLYSTFPFNLLDKRRQLHLWWRFEACLDSARISVCLDRSGITVAKSWMNTSVCSITEQALWTGPPPNPQTPHPKPQTHKPTTHTQPPIPTSHWFKYPYTNFSNHIYKNCVWQYTDNNMYVMVRRTSKRKKFADNTTQIIHVGEVPMHQIGVHRCVSKIECVQ